MFRETTVEYGGKTYRVALDQGRTIAGEADAPPPVQRWYVTLGPTAVTAFDAEPGDTEESVRGKVLQHLKGLPDLGDRDRVHLGGG